MRTLPKAIVTPRQKGTRESLPSITKHWAGQHHDSMSITQHWDSITKHRDSIAHRTMRTPHSTSTALRQHFGIIITLVPFTVWSITPTRPLAKVAVSPTTLLLARALPNRCWIIPQKRPRCLNNLKHRIKELRNEPSARIDLGRRAKAHFYYSPVERSNCRSALLVRLRR
jgi:hypothetical protein